MPRIRRTARRMDEEQHAGQAGELRDEGNDATDQNTINLERRVEHDRRIQG